MTTSSDQTPAPLTLDLDGAYPSLTELVYADRPLADTLHKMTVLATQVLDEGPQVSLTLLEQERGRTAATSGPVALQLDERQYDDGDGPCLDAARQSRAPIEQAKGILMTRHRCSSEEAFAMLVKQSQTRHVKVRDIADELVNKVG